MNALVPISSAALPALVPPPASAPRVRFLEFFAANIRNPHTRRVLDAMMLQKITQRQSNFIGLSSLPGAPSRGKMLQDE